jgi:D-serine deaminase-like pyridoxal phosphate-dependent protein
LPPLDDLDALFGRAGVARAVRARAAPKLLYSEQALRSHGFDLLLDHVREGGERKGMWRTTGRLLKLRSPGRAAKLAAALAVHWVSPVVNAGMVTPPGG